MARVPTRPCPHGQNAQVTAYVKTGPVTYCAACVAEIMDEIAKEAQKNQSSEGGKKK